MGKETYLYNLKQISDAVNETCAHGVMAALLACKTHYNELENKYGTPTVTYKDLYERDRFEFGLFQRNPKGAYILDARVSEMMRDVGVEADTIVMYVCARVPARAPARVGQSICRAV